MTGRTLTRGDGRPLWHQLWSDLRQRLESGEFDAGLPSEFALAAEYAVSRHTVREALRRMREDGAVVSTRGRVARRASSEPIEQTLSEPYSLYVAVEATGRVQRSVVHVLDVRADGVVASRLGLEESTPLVHLERLRLADSEPLAVDRIWMPESLAAPLLEVDFSHTGVYPEYRRRCGIRVTGGRENIRAVVPSDAERHLLEIGPGVAALAIERCGVADGRPVEWRHTLVRGDRFTVTAQFSDRTGYRVDLSEPVEQAPWPDAGQAGVETPIPPRRPAP